MTENQNPDQDAGPPGNGVTDQQGPHPDPPVEEQTADDDSADGADDEVDERSKESFPTSDPPSTWAGSDQP